MMDEIPKETRSNEGTALGKRKSLSSTEVTSEEVRLRCRSGRRQKIIHS